MAELTLQDLLEAGVHFGHQTSRWNPKMRRFILTERNRIHIIDLNKTLRQIELAKELLRQVVLQGHRVLFVCTKPQLRSIIEQEAERSHSWYVTERWLGGMLTNFATIKRQIRRLRELERGSEEGSFEGYTKKERLLFERERQKLAKYLAGVKDMTRLPGALYAVDPKKEHIAVREANKLGIPVVAIADTNADPDLLTVPIAGNDDAIRSVALITRVLADAIVEARAALPPEERRRADEAETTVYSSALGETKAVEAEPRRKRRPRRRRRPRVEALAELASTDEAPAGEGSGPEGTADEEADRAAEG